MSRLTAVPLQPMDHRPDGSRPATDLWWLSPLGCVAALLVLYASFSAFDYSGVVPKTYLPGWHYAWGALLLLTLFAYGFWFAPLVANPQRFCSTPWQRAKATSAGRSAAPRA